MSSAETIEEIEVSPAVRWRFDQLMRAGYMAGEAMQIAEHIEIDLHEACGLVEIGCASELALRILL